MKLEKEENKAKQTKTKTEKRKKKCRERLIIVCTLMYSELGPNVPSYFIHLSPGPLGVTHIYLYGVYVSQG